MKVAFFHRRNPYRYISIDAYFENVRQHLPAEVWSVRNECKFYSRGVLPRLYNIAEASLRQQDINHITGEVHYLALLFKRRKTVLTIHDLVFLKYSSGYKKRILKYFWLTMPVKRSSIITAVSESTKMQIVEETGCDPGKVVVVPTCINKIFVKSPKAFNSNNPVILQIGTAHNKNCVRMAKALEGLPCRLEIVGKPSPEYSEILRSCRIDHGISQHLTDDEVFEKYVSCDIVLFASEYEGFGMPIIEANAVGRAVITGNCSSMPEIAGEAACLVDPFDIQAIRNGIEKVISDEIYRNSLIEAGFENAKRFDLDTSAKAYFNIYKSLLN